MLGLEFRIYAVRVLEPAEPPKGGTPNGGRVKRRPRRFASRTGFGSARHLRELEAAAGETPALRRRPSLLPINPHRAEQAAGAEFVDDVGAVGAEDEGVGGAGFEEVGDFDGGGFGVAVVVGRGFAFAVGEGEGLAVERRGWIRLIRCLPPSKPAFAVVTGSAKASLSFQCQHPLHPLPDTASRAGVLKLLPFVPADVRLNEDAFGE